MKRTCTWLFLVAGILGCGESRTVPVEGKIVWEDGSPAELLGYEVEAGLPESRISSRGDVQAGGTFRLGTFAPGDGAEPGQLQVAIRPIPITEIDPAPTVSIPARYHSATTSGLTIDAKRGQQNLVTLTIQRR
jgi:hypothetical protein